MIGRRNSPETFAGYLASIPLILFAGIAGSLVVIASIIGLITELVISNIDEDY